MCVCVCVYGSWYASVCVSVCLFLFPISYFGCCCCCFAAGVRGPGPYYHIISSPVWMNSVGRSLVSRNMETLWFCCCCCCFRSVPFIGFNMVWWCGWGVNIGMNETDEDDKTEVTLTFSRFEPPLQQKTKLETVFEMKKNPKITRPNKQTDKRNKHTHTHTQESGSLG